MSPYNAMRSINIYPSLYNVRTSLNVQQLFIEEDAEKKDINDILSIVRKIAIGCCKNKSFNVSEVDGNFMVRVFGAFSIKEFVSDDTFKLACEIEDFYGVKI